MVKSRCSFPNVTIKLNQETFSSCRYWFLGGCRIFEYGYYGTKTGKELILYHTRSLQVRIVCVPSLGKSQLQWENTKFSFPGFKKKTLFTWQLFTCFSENGPLLLCSSTFGLSYRILNTWSGIAHLLRLNRPLDQFFQLICNRMHHSELLQGSKFTHNIQCVALLCQTSWFSSNDLFCYRFSTNQAVLSECVNSGIHVLVRWL